MASVTRYRIKPRTFQLELHVKLLACYLLFYILSEIDVYCEVYGVRLYLSLIF
jgi:hypothetical protein